MILKKIVYMVLETIRNNNIVDDEDLDTRLVEEWINLKREQFIKNNRANNPNNRTDIRLAQKMAVGVEVITATEAGMYPFSTAVEDTKIVKSVSAIPPIIEDKSGPIILSLESQDEVKYPFSSVHYDHMRFSGNGKFNSNLIYGSIRDKHLYFKYNEFFDTYTDINLLAIFQDPREVIGFDETTDDYPANLALIEYIKNAIFDKDIRMLFQGREDNMNSAESEI